MSEDENDRSPPLNPEERRRLEAVRSADSLASLAAVIGADSDHVAYLEAKADWRKLRAKELGTPRRSSGLPGDAVDIDDRSFTVHGITHRDTDPERSLLHERVSAWLEAGDTVYCEQGLRSMYLAGFPDVFEMDDYRWAMYHCRNEDVDSHIDDVIEATFEEGITADVSELATRFREVTFSAIDSGTDVYGDRIATAFGDLASSFLMGHEGAATVSDFTSFRLSRQAARNPEMLGALQYYYKCAMLPQPLEREWLRRHDREIELFTHARNERMASYARFHAPDAGSVHLIVGAAHQPGVAYYLQTGRDEWTPAEFESIP